MPPTTTRAPASSTPAPEGTTTSGTSGCAGTTSSPADDRIDQLATTFVVMEVMKTGALSDRRRAQYLLAMYGETATHLPFSDLTIAPPSRSLSGLAKSSLRGDSGTLAEVVASIALMNDWRVTGPFTLSRTSLSSAP